MFFGSCCQSTEVFGKKVQRWGDSRASPGNQPTFLGEFQVSETSCLKTNKMDGFWEMTSEVILWLPHVYIQTHKHTHAHTCICTHKMCVCKTMKEVRFWSLSISILVTLTSRSLENGTYLVYAYVEEQRPLWQSDLTLMVKAYKALNIYF